MAILRTENRVGSSILSLGTINFRGLRGLSVNPFLFMFSVPEHKS